MTVQIFLVLAHKSHDKIWDFSCPLSYLKASEALPQISQGLVWASIRNMYSTVSKFAHILTTTKLRTYATFLLHISLQTKVMAKKLADTGNMKRLITYLGSIVIVITTRVFTYN